MVVHAYVMYNFSSDSQFDDIKGFLRVADFDGLNNRFDEPSLPMQISPSSSVSGGAQSTPRAAAPATVLQSPMGNSASSLHRIARLHTLGSIAWVHQQKCVVCKKLVSFLLIDCLLS
eukprot:4437032-Pleurochrysis_carterae.AAC.3